MWLITQPQKKVKNWKERRVSFRNGLGLGIVAQGGFLLIRGIPLSLLVHRGGMHDIP
jgi:hypothetical protein